jgi:hypothetical protein
MGNFMKSKQISNLERAEGSGRLAVPSAAWQVDEPIAISISVKPEEIPDPPFRMRMLYQQGGWIVVPKKAPFVQQRIEILLEKESLC